MVELDHVFVCCSAGAPEAAALARLGLKEGSGNQHPGQGTACRRFFFGNGYLELLWVEDEAEVQSELTRPLRLWERWSRRGQDACPFGVVLRPGPEPEDGPPPFATWPYHPQYLPPNLAIEVGVGTTLDEPELFYLPWARAREPRVRQPTDHEIPVRSITGLTIGTPAHRALSLAARSTERAGVLTFRPADEYLLSLAFDGERQGHSADLRPHLPLELRW